MAENECNCPPMADVMRGRAGETKPPCPAHPEPPNLAEILLPRVELDPLKVAVFPVRRTRARRS
jgi:hypothetical protein